MRRTFIIVGLALLASASSPKAAAPRLFGVVAAVVDNSLQIKRSSEPTTTIKTDSRTAYMKWITHKPWQQDTQFTRQALGVGRCVEIALRSDDSGVAKLVRISADDAGTIYDPCKTLR